MSEEAGLRIATAVGEDGGLGLQLSLAEEPGEGDQVVDRQDAHVFLEPRAASLLESTVLDVRDPAGEPLEFLLSAREGAPRNGTGGP